MTDYISREEAINAVYEAYADGESAYDALEKLPAADVKPVVRATWREGVFAGCRCPVCVTTWDVPTNFCPYCGADMRPTAEIDKRHILLGETWEEYGDDMTAKMLSEH